MWSPLWSLLVCKIPQFLTKSYPFRQLITLFQKVDTLRLLKIYIMFCQPAGAKYPFSLGSSSQTVTLMDCYAILINVQPPKSVAPHKSTPSFLKQIKHFFFTFFSLLSSPRDTICILQFTMFDSITLQLAFDFITIFHAQSLN